MDHEAQSHCQTRGLLSKQTQRPRHALTISTARSSVKSEVLARHFRSDCPHDYHRIQVRPAILREAGDECGNRAGVDVHGFAGLADRYASAEREEKGGRSVSLEHSPALFGC